MMRIVNALTMLLSDFPFIKLKKAEPRLARMRKRTNNITTFNMGSPAKLFY